MFYLNKKYLYLQIQEIQDITSENCPATKNQSTTKGKIDRIQPWIKEDNVWHLGELEQSCTEDLGGGCQHLLFTLFVLRYIIWTFFFDIMKEYLWNITHTSCLVGVN